MIGLASIAMVQSFDFVDCGWQKTRQTVVVAWSLLTVQSGTVGCKAESWRAEVVMFLCLHTNLLLCSAQQHCPPAPSSLPTLVPPGRHTSHRHLMATTLVMIIMPFFSYSFSSRSLGQQKSPTILLLSPLPPLTFLNS